MLEGIRDKKVLVTGGSGGIGHRGGLHGIGGPCLARRERGGKGPVTPADAASRPYHAESFQVHPSGVGGREPEQRVPTKRSGGVLVRGPASAPLSSAPRFRRIGVVRLRRGLPRPRPFSPAAAGRVRRARARGREAP